MWGEVLGQYAIVIFAFGCLLALKFYVINKRVNKQNDSYVNPQQCIDKLGKEMGKEDGLKVLESYVGRSGSSTQRFRNIAILVAFINSKEKQPKKSQPLTALLKATGTLPPIQQKYRQYIVKNTQKWV